MMLARTFPRAPGQDLECTQGSDPPACPEHHDQRVCLIHRARPSPTPNDVCVHVYVLEPAQHHHPKTWFDLRVWRRQTFCLDMSESVREPGQLRVGYVV